MEVEQHTATKQLFPPYFTHIQLLTAYILELVKKHKQANPELKLQVDGLDMPTQEIFVLHFSSIHGEIKLKILQMLNIIKLYVQTDGSAIPHIVWFNHKSFVKASLVNTLSLKLVINEKRLVSILTNRLLAKLDKNLSSKPRLLQTVLGEQLQAVTVLKYLTVKDLRSLQLANTTIYESCNSKKIYKALYELRFGRTGFGFELEWKTLFFNKTGRNFI